MLSQPWLEIYHQPSPAFWAAATHINRSNPRAVSTTPGMKAGLSLDASRVIDSVHSVNIDQVNSAGQELSQDLSSLSFWTGSFPKTSFLDRQKCL